MNCLFEKSLNRWTCDVKYILFWNNYYTHLKSQNIFAQSVTQSEIERNQLAVDSNGSFPLSHTQEVLKGAAAQGPVLTALLSWPVGNLHSSNCALISGPKQTVVTTGVTLHRNLLHEILLRCMSKTFFKKWPWKSRSVNKVSSLQLCGIPHSKRPKRSGDTIKTYLNNDANGASAWEHCI